MRNAKTVIKSSDRINSFSRKQGKKSGITCVMSPLFTLRSHSFSRLFIHVKCFCWILTDSDVFGHDSVAQTGFLLSDNFQRCYRNRISLFLRYVTDNNELKCKNGQTFLLEVK